MLCSFQSTKVHRQRLLLKSHPVAQSTNGGDEEDRTPDPLRARQVLSQLSYTPIRDLLLRCSVIFRFVRKAPLSLTAIDH